MARTFTAAEVQAIIEAERRGEFQLPEGDYNDETLAAALTLLTVEQGGHVSTLDVPEDCAMTPTISPATAFDYRHQAWVMNGHYVRCGHLAPCDCYGRKHAGELPAADADIH